MGRRTSAAAWRHTHGGARRGEASGTPVRRQATLLRRGRRPLQRRPGAAHEEVPARAGQQVGAYVEAEEDDPLHPYDYYSDSD